MSTMPFPQPPPNANPALFGWAGSNINQPSSPFPAPSPLATPPTGPSGNPGNLPNPTSNLKDMIRNAGYLGVQQGQLRNELIPQFANLMMQYGPDAANIFKNFANFGSPFYKAQQSDVFTQGTKATQDAAALARQQLSAQGYGATPSGANAAMIGGINTAGGNNLVEQFLNTLFQNAGLMMQGAQGEASVAGMYNPASLFGATGPTGTTQGPNATENFKNIMEGLGIGQGGSSPTYSSKAGFGLGR